MGLNTGEIWLPGGAVVAQQPGPDAFEPVDGIAGSDQAGFCRGFSTSFRLRPSVESWFHFPFALPVGHTRLTGLSLLWETLEGASLGWITVQHGGMERIELTGRHAPVEGEPVPFDVPEAARPYYPENARRLSRFALSAPVPLRFGVQLSVMARTPEAGGVIRFYGAGASFDTG